MLMPGLFCVESRKNEHLVMLFSVRIVRNCLLTLNSGNVYLRQDCQELIIVILMVNFL